MMNFDRFDRTPYDQEDRQPDSLDMPFEDFTRPANYPRRCRHCTEPLHTFAQSALMPGCVSRTYVECHNAQCVLWMQTFCSEDYGDVDLMSYAGQYDRTAPTVAEDSLYSVYAVGDDVTVFRAGQYAPRPAKVLAIRDDGQLLVQMLYGCKVWIWAQELVDGDVAAAMGWAEEGEG